MLLRSQPLAPEVSKKIKPNSDDEFASMSEQNIKSQRIGRMFDDILSGEGKRRIKLKTRLKWRLKHVKESFYDFKYTYRNHKKWHNTMKALRPWEGFNGLIDVMMTHLNDYILHEEQYGHSTEAYRNQKVTSAKETIELLIRMKEPNDYYSRRRKEVEDKYPRYLSLITEYETGGTSVSGDFVAQRNGWVGEESGADPRAGYFEFIDGRFELAISPDQRETDRLLSELHNYHEELQAAYLQAETDSDDDFEKLGHLLKDNLYAWWD
ncbi:hypothetical protein LJC56_11135 [Christensenellaceae bacterium OttesenSCG-928-K19]|nr:hypothetical protein [Christensenellaceae bacterium OttesenSCG-928-K19]